MYKLLALGSKLLIIMGFCATIGMTAISSYNYPGGEALQALHIEEAYYNNGTYSLLT